MGHTYNKYLIITIPEPPAAPGTVESCVHDPPPPPPVFSTPAVGVPELFAPFGDPPPPYAVQLG